MSYIGNNPDVNAFTVSVERFSGTGSCTQFQLERTNYSDNAAIEVVISGAQQDPTANYGVQNGLITFTSAPAVGSNNIVVTYRAPVVVTFNQVGPTQLQANSVTQTTIASDAVTTVKIQDQAVLGTKLGINSVSGNNLGSGSVSGNNLGAGAVSGNQIGIGAVSGNQIGLFAVSGNNLGIGSVSANNFAGGGITSNVLSPNLSISISRVLETANVYTSPTVSGNLHIDVSNNTVYFFTANTSANVFFNFRGNSVNTLDSTMNVGQAISVAIGLRHNVAGGRHVASINIDGGLIATTRANPDSGNVIFYSGNTVPQYLDGGTLAGLNKQGLEFNLYAITILKRAANTYTVLQANTIYGLGY